LTVITVSATVGMSRPVTVSPVIVPTLSLTSPLSSRFSTSPGRTVWPNVCVPSPSGSVIDQISPAIGAPDSTTVCASADVSASASAIAPSREPSTVVRP
jgi:hypothetical protein